MAYYMSMQAVRFRSPNDLELFKVLLKDALKRVKEIEGFVNVNYWAHLDDPQLFLETSIWESKAAAERWDKNPFHQRLKEWGYGGPIMEDTITNWMSAEVRISRRCPLCGKSSGRPFELKEELKDKSTPCECGFAFPYLGTTDNFAVFAG